MNIRPFDLSDKPGIIKILSQTNAYHAGLQPDVFNVLPPESLLPEGWLEEIYVSETRNIFLGVQGEEIIGLVQFAILETDDELEKIKKWVHINEIVVSEAHRGTGAGRKLIEAVEQFAKKNGAKRMQLEVWENNESAIRFYERSGFERKKHEYWKSI